MKEFSAKHPIVFGAVLFIIALIAALVPTAALQMAGFTTESAAAIGRLIVGIILLAHRSTVVARMVAAAAAEKDIADYVIGTRFRNITGNHDLTDEQVSKMAELIDEIDPRGAFKELKAKIREMSGKAKKK